MKYEMNYANELVKFMDWFEEEIGSEPQRLVLSPKTYSEFFSEFLYQEIPIDWATHLNDGGSESIKTNPTFMGVEIRASRFVQNNHVLLLGKGGNIKDYIFQDYVDAKIQVVIPSSDPLRSIEIDDDL